MSIIAVAVKHLVAAGVTGDALVTAIKEMESQLETRSPGAIRQERYRRNKASQTVTTVTDDVTRDANPTPPLIPPSDGFPDPSLTPPYNPPVTLSDEDKSSSSNSPKPQKIEFDFEEKAFRGITDKDRDLWRKTYPAIDVEQEILKASSWLDANPKNRKSQYRRFLNAWFSRQQDNAGRIVVNGRDPPKTWREIQDEKNRQAIEEARKRYV